MIARFKTADEAQDRGLAAAGRAKEGQEFAIVDREGEVLQGDKAREGFCDVGKLNYNIFQSYIPQ